MTKAFIKSDISITSLLNCFRIRCLFNNVFSNTSLKREFIGVTVLSRFYYAKRVALGHCCNPRWQLYKEWD